MRLFISINVPKELSRYCEQLQKQFPDLKETREFHMTIQFLGDEIEDPTSIIDALSKIKFEPFEIEMGDAVPFPNLFQPRGVWIECDPSAVLLNLADEIRQSLEELGYMNDKPFRAHITLGRYKRPPHQKPKKTEGETNRFKVERFCLMESTLTPEGPKYKTVASFPK